jgi:hypothetical protein
MEGESARKRSRDQEGGKVWTKDFPVIAGCTAKIARLK